MQLYDVKSFEGPDQQPLSSSELRVGPSIDRQRGRVEDLGEESDALAVPARDPQESDAGLQKFGFLV